MTAAYRLKGIGWFAVMMAVILGSYLVSLRVAAEHKKLDDLELRITSAQRDIRALETEFDTRANLVQLERWNGDTLALVAPTAAQFVSDDTALASLSPDAPGVPEVRTAALLVPALTPAQIVTSAVAVSAPAPSAPIRLTVAVPIRPAVAETKPTGRVAQAMEAVPSAATVAKVRPQAVAMLDRKLLSDTTFGDIMSGARREARR